jgi:hypothetical protein
VLYAHAADADEALHPELEGGVIVGHVPDLGGWRMYSQVHAGLGKHGGRSHAILLTWAYHAPAFAHSTAHLH